MPIYTPALDLILNLADKSASGRLSLSGSHVVAAPASSSTHRIVLGDTGHCRVRACTPNPSGSDRAFDDVDLSISTVRVALGIPGEDPYCLATLSTPFPSAAAQITSPQSATVDLPATKRITLDPAPYGGSFIVTLDDNNSFEIPFDADGAQLQALAGPAYSVRKRAANAWDISGTEPNQDVIISLDLAGLLVPSGVTDQIALNTTALAAAFAAAGNPKWLKVSREVEIDGVKVFQDDKVEIARAILDVSALVPTPLPPSDVAAINTALASKQPISSQLTALAGLTTTSWGRALLALSDAGALGAYASLQPLNSQLSAIASLATASYGRGILTQPDAASLRSYIGNSFANLAAKPTTIAGYGITDNSFANLLSKPTTIAGYGITDNSFANLLSKPTTISGYGITDLNSLGDARWSLLGHTHAFSSLTGAPTTISGYGITDLNSLGDARWVQAVNLNSLGDARWSSLGHTHAFADLTGTLAFASLSAKPTTISGYGITDLNTLGDARWSALGHSHAFSSLTGAPTTLAGYGITDSVALRNAANTFSLLQTFNAIASSSVTASQLTDPGAPTVTPVGSDEGGTWSYKIVAKLSDGTPTAAGPAGTTTHGDQTLDSTNKISLSWTAVPGAVSYDVYRTAHGISPSTTGKIATVFTNSYVDTGNAGDSTPPPAVNVTGHVTGAILDNGGQVFNVKAGSNPAMGDGVTDDTAAVQARIDAAGAVNGSVFFPQGDYLVTTLNGNAGVRLFGVGASVNGSRLLTISNAPLLNITARCTVDNLTLIGNGNPAFTAQDLILVNATSDTVLSNLTLTHGYNLVRFHNVCWQTPVVLCRFLESCNSAITTTVSGSPSAAGQQIQFHYCQFDAGSLRTNYVGYFENVGSLLFNHCVVNHSNTLHGGLFFNTAAASYGGVRIIGCDIELEDGNGNGPALVIKGTSGAPFHSVQAVGSYFGAGNLSGERCIELYYSTQNTFNSCIITSPQRGVYLLKNVTDTRFIGCDFLTSNLPVVSDGEQGTSVVDNLLFSGCDYKGPNTLLTLVGDTIVNNVTVRDSTIGQSAPVINAPAAGKAVLFDGCWGGDGTADFPPYIQYPKVFLTPDPTNGWTNLGTPWENAGYIKEDNRVNLFGVLVPGTTTGGTGFFSSALPVGFRPSKQQVFIGINGNVIRVDTDGKIRIDTYVSGNVFLNCVSFSIL